MKTKMAILGLFIVLSSLVIFLLGCPPPVVRVRPPEPRVEVYGPPPQRYLDPIWIPGYWRYRGGDWVWISGHWERRPRPHAVWVPSHWEPRGEGWVFVKGHWEYR